MTPIVSRAKSMWYKPKKVKKLALNSQLLTIQILTTDVQVLILRLILLLLYLDPRKWASTSSFGDQLNYAFKNRNKYVNCTISKEVCNIAM